MPKFDKEKFSQEFLSHHNQIRLEHRAPPLEWDEDLKKKAKEWAKVLAEKGDINEHLKLNATGENTLHIKGAEPNPERLCQKLCEGSKDYDFAGNLKNEACLHFTQIIWVNSEKFGTWVKRVKDGSFIVVALYYPTGNVKSEFSRNVFPKGTEIVKRSKLSSLPLENIPDQQTIRDFSLKIINEIREKHSSPPLNWDEELEKIAVQYAKEICIAKKQQKEDSIEINEKFGANSLVSKIGAPSIQYTCWRFYQTGEGYNYDLNEFQKECASFTQMVWFDSRTFAAGYYRDGDTYAVSHLFSPPGNFEDGYTRNVSRPNDKVLTYEC